MQKYTNTRNIVEPKLLGRTKYLTEVTKTMVDIVANTVLTIHPNEKSF